MSHSPVADEPSPSQPVRRHNEDEIDSSQPPDLSELTPEQRRLYFKTSFTKHVEPLAYISRPDECDQFPEHENEILAAYLHYTTFTIKVWTNYDAAAKKFYLDPRINACGKPIMKPRERDRLAQIDAQGSVEVHRLQLEIGTPFTNLCTVKFHAGPSLLHSGTDLRATQVAPTDAQHPRAIDFVQTTCREFNDAEIRLAAGQRGVRLRDFEGLASWFVRRATGREMRWTSAGGDWMDFCGCDGRNDGWVDFEATGQGCGSGCQGCSGSQYRWAGGGGFFGSNGSS